MNSAVRRHHYRRLQKTRKNYWFGGMDNKELGMIANTPHPCSCVGGCGHMRQMYGPTRQELRNR